MILQQGCTQAIVGITMKPVSKEADRAKQREIVQVRKLTMNRIRQHDKLQPRKLAPALRRQLWP
eukprot:3003842-Amphidinium_carterae.1